MLCTFWLRHVLRATTACTFSTSQLPKVVRQWCAFRTRRFSEPTFRPSGTTNHWKNTMFRDLPTFSRICMFFLLTLSLLWFSLFYSSLLSDPSMSAFHLSILSEVWLLISFGYTWPCRNFTKLMWMPCSISAWHVLHKRSLIKTKMNEQLQRDTSQWVMIIYNPWFW